MKMAKNSRFRGSQKSCCPASKPFSKSKMTAPQSQKTPMIGPTIFQMIFQPHRKKAGFLNMGNS